MKKLLLVCSLFLIGHLLNGQSLSEVVLVDIDDSKYYNLNQLIGDSRTLIIFVDNDCPYVDYYNMSMINPNLYSRPRTIRLGVKLDF